VSERTFSISTPTLVPVANRLRCRRHRCKKKQEAVGLRQEVSSNQSKIKTCTLIDLSQNGYGERFFTMKKSGEKIFTFFIF